LKKAALVVLVSATLATLALLGAAWWGRSRLAAFAATWRADVAAERARAAARRSPVLRGEARPENAAPVYRKVLDGVDTGDEAALSPATATRPGARLPAGVSALLEKHRGDLEALDRALLDDRCDWETRFEDGLDGWFPGMAAGHALTTLLVLDGHARAARGDVPGAAARYLDVVRFGADLGTPGSLVSVVLGMDVQARGLDALTILVISGEAGVPRAEIEAAFAKLEPLAPGAGDGLLGERLCLGWFFDRRFSDHPAVLARGVATIDAVLRDAEKVARSDDRAARARIALEQEATGPSASSVAAMALPDCTGAMRAGDSLAARYALLHAAIAIEGARTEDGFPATPALPIDPCAPPAKLGYETSPDGRGYRLWSAGANGRDDGGHGDDIAFERRARGR
jgi:hypothetical protein